MVRGSLISNVYHKTLELRQGDIQGSTAYTLMGNDVERIVLSLTRMHELWASCIEIGIALWLLERQLLVACIGPVILALGRASRLRFPSATCG
jgi:ATP-binding cassette subfamily C (CFTR/MRP) protein 1